METTKQKITNVVKTYQEVFNREFQNFLLGQKPKTDAAVTDNKFAELKGSDVVERQLGEIPETLFVLLMKHLSPEEYVWYQSRKGAQWFYNTFKEFKVTGGKV